MKTLSKAFAALVAAFTLMATPAFATEYKPLDGAKVYDCRLTGNSVGYKTEVLTEYTDEEIRGLAAAGLKPTSRKYWTVTTAKRCEDLLVKKPTLQKAEVKVSNCEAAKENLAGKFSWQGWQQQTMNKDCQNLKIQPKKPEVKILGGRPIIKNPEKHLGKSYDYCKDGRLHKISIVPNQVFDNSFSETCLLDTSKTLVLADLAPTALPAEPTVDEVKQEIIKNNLPPSDGMGDFCKDGSPWIAYAKALNNGKTYKISKYASTSKDPCVIGKTSFRLELAEPHE